MCATVSDKNSAALSDRRTTGQAENGNITSWIKAVAMLGPDLSLSGIAQQNLLKGHITVNISSQPVCGSFGHLTVSKIKHLKGRL